MWGMSGGEGKLAINIATSLKVMVQLVKNFRSYALTKIVITGDFLINHFVFRIYFMGQCVTGTNSCCNGTSIETCYDILSILHLTTVGVAQTKDRWD